MDISSFRRWCKSPTDGISAPARPCRASTGSPCFRSMHVPYGRRTFDVDKRRRMVQLWRFEVRQNTRNCVQYRSGTNSHDNVSLPYCTCALESSFSFAPGTNACSISPRFLWTSPASLTYFDWIYPPTIRKTIGTAIPIANVQ